MRWPAVVVAILLPLSAAAQPGDEPVSLRDLIETRLASLDRDIAGLRREMLVQAASAKEALSIALAALDVRFASVNEFRQTLTDQARTFATNAAIEPRFAALEAISTGLVARVGAIESAGSPTAARAAADVQRLAERLSEIEAQSRGRADVWAAGGIIAGLAIGAAGAFLAFRRQQKSA